MRGLLLLLALVIPTPPGSSPVVEHGVAKYYSRGIMQRVASYRGLTLPQGYDGFASRPNCNTIGQPFYARVSGVDLLLVQADCSAPQDVARHYKEGLVVELSYEMAQRTGMVRDGRAQADVWGR